MAQHLVQPRLDPRRDRALQAGRLLVRFGPAQPDHRREQPFQKRVAAEDAVRRGPPGIGQDELAAAGLRHEIECAEAERGLTR